MRTLDINLAERRTAGRAPAEADGGRFVCGWVNSARQAGERGTFQASASGRSLTRNHRIRQSAKWSGAALRKNDPRRTLANVLSQIKYDGAVAACGLAQGSDLPATVLPFILRDVTLSGVNSVLTPREKREEAWGRLASDLDLAKLNSMTTRARLDDVPALAAEVLAGKTRGRVVIDL